MSFSDKVVIVTGASSGIGAATAKHFSKSGAKVVMVGRNEAKLKRVEDACAQVGAPPLVIKADVGKDRDAERVIEETIKKYGKIDVLVNSAGILVSGHSLLQGNLIRAYDEIMQVNIRAVVVLTALATPYLTQSKGSVVNVSSVSGISANAPEFLAYSVSKAAVDHFTRGAAFELASVGVRVNSVRAGLVRTDLLDTINSSLTWDDYAKTLPLQRVSEPEEIARMIVFLASDDARGITGSHYVCDNGGLLGTYSV